MYKILKYKELSEDHFKSVYEFLKNKERIDNISELKEIYDIELYDYGSGVLFYFIEDKVVASITVVLEPTKVLNTSYIYNIIFDEGIKDELNLILRGLIKEGISLAKDYGAKDIRLGISEDIKNTLDGLGFKYEYKSIKMRLDDYDTKTNYDELSLKELDYSNKSKYIEIYNDSFNDIPHGGFIEENKVNEYLNKKDNDSNDYFCYLVCDNNKEIGFMEVDIKDGAGLFDIGLSKRYRGKGYGKRLLETAILYLKNENASINLIVIEENEIAYELYKKRGFKEEFVMNYWLKISPPCHKM